MVEPAEGQDVLAAVAQRPPDLIVLDVLMDGGSGWDTLAALKADGDARTREIPVVVLGATSTPLDRIRAGIEGAVHHLGEPIAADELRAAVTAVLVGGPEPEQRRQAQQRALEELARLERGDAGAPLDPTVPRPRLSGLEPTRAGARSTVALAPPDLRAGAATLTAKQVELVQAVHRHSTVQAAAAELEMSRSNVYASLRRIARRLGVRSVSELLDHVRAGRVVE